MIFVPHRQCACRVFVRPPHECPTCRQPLMTVRRVDDYSAWLLGFMRPTGGGAGRPSSGGWSGRGCASTGTLKQIFIIFHIPTLSMSDKDAG